MPEVIYPEAVALVLNRLTQAGHKAYIVGGALRDALRGVAAHDFDVATSALPQETAALFDGYHVIATGLKHGTITVIIERLPIEITTFRVDGDYRDARHPSNVTFTRRIEDDLARRDFTINAMAYHPQEGLIDLFGGALDLTAGIVRAVGDPTTRFGEDALRILRAFRFVSKLGFSIDPATLAATEACREGLARISAERITSELWGLLEGKCAEAALSLMVDNGIFEAFAVDFVPCRKAIIGIDALPPVAELRMAYFLRSSPRKSEGLLRHLRLSNASSARIKKLLSLRETDLTSPAPKKVRLWLASAGAYTQDIVPLISAGDFFYTDSPEKLLSLVQSIQENRDCLDLSALAVGGKELWALGCSGREVGRLLAKLLDMVLDDPAKNTRESLLALAQTYLNFPQDKEKS